MKSLLRSNEMRRLRIAEILYDRDDWMTISELSKKLNVSIRILKYDLENFKQSFDDFTIETSHHGVQLHLYKNKGLKTLYHNVLKQSTAFQLLEIIFFNEKYSTFELADLLFVSPSTLYRMIDHINGVISKRGFQIETNPCRIVGDEAAIRSFFSKYLFEKYTQLDVGYQDYEEGIDNFLYFIIDLVQLRMDFALFNIFKLLTTVGYIRYKQNHLMAIDETRSNYREVIPVLEMHAEPFQYFEEALELKVDYELFHQLFTPFIHENFSLTYARLIDKTIQNHEIKKRVDYLDDMLDDFSMKHHLPLLNKENIILSTLNAAAIEKFDPRSGYILHDRNRHFVSGIEKEFPHFYQDLYEGLKQFRKIAGLEDSEEQLNYLMYITYSIWEGLTLNLRKKYAKIRILLVSDRHPSHANMLKEFIEYELSGHLSIDIFDDLYLSKTILEELDYDFIVANFPLPILQSKNCICIENIPTFHDLTKIRNEIDELYLSRIKH